MHSRHSSEESEYIIAGGFERLRIVENIEGMPVGNCSIDIEGLFSTTFPQT